MSDTRADGEAKFKWGTDYGKDLLVDLNQLAHAAGTGPLHRDAFQRAYAEVASLSRQLAEARAALKETSDALLTVAPLGGSECFRQVAGEHYADPFFLGQRIQELHNSRHEVMKRAIRAERQLAEAHAAMGTKE